MEDQDDYKTPKAILTTTGFLAVGFQMLALWTTHHTSPPKVVDIHEIVTALRTKPVAALKAPKQVTNSPFARHLNEVRENYIAADQMQVADETTDQINYIRLSSKLMDRIAAAKPVAPAAPAPEAIEAPAEMIATAETAPEGEDVAAVGGITIKAKFTKHVPKPKVAQSQQINANDIISVKGQQKIKRNLTNMKKELDDVFSASGYVKLKPYVEATARITGFSIVDSWTLAFYESRVAQKVQYNFLTFYPDAFSDQIVWYGAELADEMAKSGVGTINGKNYQRVAKQLAGLMNDYDRLTQKKSKTHAECALLGNTRRALNDFYKDPLMLLCVTAKHLQSTERYVNNKCPNKALLREVGPGVYRLGHLFGKGGTEKYLMRATNGSLVNSSISHRDIRRYYIIDDTDLVITAVLKISKEYNELRGEIAKNLGIPDERKPLVAQLNSANSSPVGVLAQPTSLLLAEPSGSEARMRALNGVQMAYSTQATATYKK